MPQPATTEPFAIEPFDLLAHADEAAALQIRALTTVAEHTGVPHPGGGGAQYERHAQREGFRAVAAWGDGRLVGFAYGITAQAGSWWDQWVGPSVRAAGEGDLLPGAFEVVQLMVDPAHHRRGLGRALLTALLDGLPHPRVLLTTQDGPNPARRFYAAHGFREVTGGPVADGAPYLVLERPLHPAG